MEGSSERVHLQASWSPTISKSVARFWTKFCFLLLLTAAPISWSFGLIIGISISISLGFLLLIGLVFLGQIWAFEGQVLLDPLSIEIFKGGGLTIDGISLSQRQNLKIFISRHSSSNDDDDNFSVDLISPQLFIQLDSFQTARLAQQFARSFSAWLEPEPLLELKPRSPSPFPISPFVWVFLLGSLFSAPLSFLPLLLELQVPALEGLLCALLLAGISLLFSLIFSWILRRRLRHHLKREYGIVKNGASENRSKLAESLIVLDSNILCLSSTLQRHQKI